MAIRVLGVRDFMLNTSNANLCGEHCTMITTEVKNTLMKFLFCDIHVLICKFVSNTY
jgi:hypothetical protein